MSRELGVHKLETENLHIYSNIIQRAFSGPFLVSCKLISHQTESGYHMKHEKDPRQVGRVGNHNLDCPIVGLTNLFKIIQAFH